MWRFALATLVACSSPRRPVVNPPSEQHRAVLRIDAEPGGKRFQGVWLDFSGTKRWVIAYRASDLWRAFADHEVVVTGHCYAPDGQAIMAPHFLVERMRFVTPQRGRGRLLEVGPAEDFAGAFGEYRYPEGSKLAGDTRMQFIAEDNTAYWIAGGDPPASPGPARIRARRVEPDMSVIAQPGGPSLWLLGAAGEGEYAFVPCP